MPRLILAVVLGAAALAAGCGGGGGPSSSGQESPPTEAEGHVPVASSGDEPALVAALGDSITAGSPLWDPDPAVRRAIGASADRRSQYEHWAEHELGDGLELRNCGVFGERTDEIATRLEDCVAGADALIVQGGINDIAQGRPVEEAARDLEAMVRRGRELGLETTLVEVLPWNNGYPRADREIRGLNELIRRIGAERGVPVLPFYEALEDPAQPGRMAPDLTIDGDHPSIEGYRLLGELVEPSG